MVCHKIHIKIFCIILALSILASAFSGCAKKDGVPATLNAASSDAASPDSSTPDAAAMAATSTADAAGQKKAPPEPVCSVSLEQFSGDTVFAHINPPEEYVQYDYASDETAARSASFSISGPPEALAMSNGKDTCYYGYCIYDDLGGNLNILSTHYVKYMPASPESTDFDAKTELPGFEIRLKQIKRDAKSKGFFQTYEKYGEAFGMNAAVYVFENDENVWLMLILDNQLRDQDALLYKVTAIGDKHNPASIDAMLNIFYSFNTTENPVSIYTPFVPTPPKTTTKEKKAEPAKGPIGSEAIMLVSAPKPTLQLKITKLGVETAIGSFIKKEDLSGK